MSNIKITYQLFQHLTVVAFGGILGNVASCYILSRREMRNSFNLLLVMLSVYDTFYLLFAILDSCRKFFEVHKKVSSFTHLYAIFSASHIRQYYFLILMQTYKLDTQYANIFPLGNLEVQKMFMGCNQKYIRKKIEVRRCFQAN